MNNEIEKLCKELDIPVTIFVSTPETEDSKILRERLEALEKADEEKRNFYKQKLEKFYKEKLKSIMK